MEAGKGSEPRPKAPGSLEIRRRDSGRDGALYWKERHVLYRSRLQEPRKICELRILIAYANPRHMKPIRPATNQALFPPQHLRTKRSVSPMPFTPSSELKSIRIGPFILFD